MAESLRVAVTGGSGKVGRWVVRSLLDRGHSVVNIDREPGDDDRARFIAGDVRERDVIEPILRDCDAVCHLADIPNSDAPFTFDEIYWSNARSGSVVLQAAADLRLRHAVYTSSCQVYGVWGQNRVVPSKLPFDEDYPVNPRNVYAVSKAANELFARYLSEQDKLAVSILRFPWVVTDAKDEASILQRCGKEGPLEEGLATFVHASDLARAYVAAIEASRPGFEIYNISASDVYSLKPLRERIEKYHPDYPRLPAGWPDRKSPISIEKAQKFLQWRPEWTFTEHLSASGSRS